MTCDKQYMKTNANTEHNLPVLYALSNDKKKNRLLALTSPPKENLVSQTSG